MNIMIQPARWWINFLLYGCDVWTMEKSDCSKIQAAETKYLRAAKGCRRADLIRNDKVRKELTIFSICEKITFYTNAIYNIFWKTTYKEWTIFTFCSWPTMINYHQFLSLEELMMMINILIWVKNKSSYRLRMRKALLKKEKGIKAKVFN